MKKITASAAAIVAAFANFSAEAAEIRPYVGLDAVWDDVGLDDGMSAYLKDGYKSFKVNAGVRANDRFGVEVFYQHSGKEGKTVPTVFVNVLERITARIEAFGADVKGYLPVGGFEKAEFYGTIGVARYDFDGQDSAFNTATGAFASEDVSEKSTGFRFGIGAQYRFDDHWSADLSCRYVKLNGGDDDAFNNLKEVSAGVKYTF